MTESSPLPPSDADFTRLRRENLGTDPLVAFQGWLRYAETNGEMNYPNACTLATVDPDGKPEGRIVLVKGVDDDSVHFYTNYRSAKARSLQATPHAALTFYWDGLGRQVRIRGGVEPLPDEVSDAYFRTRPRLSRLGAWASKQSRGLGSREVLEERLREMKERFGDGEIPRPPHWGGYRLVPLEVEFWAAGDHRLHDRFRFRREAPGEGWVVTRLYP